MRNSYAEVNLAVIRANMAAVRQRVGVGVTVIAVVKANGYGHGPIEVSRALLEAGADMLAVALPDEGVELRRAGFTCPILVMGSMLGREVPLALEHDLMLTIFGEPFAYEVAAQAEAQGRRCTVHIKVDTGMGRLGILAENALEVVPRIVGLPGLEVVGLSTHFPSADEADKTFTYNQVEIFRNTLRGLEEAGLSFRYIHAANSAAILDIPEAHFNTVRPGIILYGLAPSDEILNPIPLSPALTLKSVVTYLKDVPAGSPLSYGRAFTTQRPSRIVSVPVGYADGYPRALGNRAQVAIGGRFAPVVGRVCMDQFLVDVTDIPQVAVGDEVVLYSNQADQPNSVESVARLLSTIPYELVTSITGRVPRVYINV